MSTYLPNIPQPNDNLDISQTQLLGNFQALNTIFGINHYPFNDLSSSKGKHKFVTMPITTTPASLDGEVVLYSQTTGALKSILKMVRDNVSQTDVALTTNKVAAPVAGASNKAPGYSWLPGEILVQWGYVTNTTGVVSGTVTFSSANVAFPNNLYTVLCQPTVLSPSASKAYGVTVTPDNTLTNKNQFTWQVQTNDTTLSIPKVVSFYWFAIGN